MDNIHDFFKKNKKAVLFSKFRNGEKFKFLDYLWLLKETIISEFPKEIILSFPTGLGFKLRYFYFKRKLNFLGNNTLLGKNIKISGENNIKISSFSWVDDYVSLTADFGAIVIGKRVHIAPFSILSGGGKIIIEDFVGISSNVHIYSHSEIPKRGKRMSGPMVNESQKGFKSAPIYLKNNCFISSGAIILPGVTIGEGAIVSANSVVTKDVEPWSIVLGNPAKKIGKRPR